MKMKYIFIFSLFFMALMASCGQKKQQVAVEAEVQDWGVVTQEITIDDQPVATGETPTP
ncbi:hypothetical protein M2137_002695 [Parabacteroides sp. PFB2-10]|uniref:hypothetical protein n=1 Tax=Parabacteroides sp. PFB2-10 TaxID=1742405 RepID=UPI0024758370|nr:hypothetical protein [Parabacteroides sp. PFB2-10]MDH6313904.1 hypothetical protein [Parabacteroides sp. PFB2-10]